MFSIFRLFPSHFSHVAHSPSHLHFIKVFLYSHQTEGTQWRGEIGKSLSEQHEWSTLTSEVEGEEKGFIFFFFILLDTNNY